MQMETIFEFVVLSHYLNFTEAAEKLNISQSNLSKHIAEMEREIGFPLFVRKRNLELTPAGVVFQEDAIQIHHLYLEAIDRGGKIASNTKEELVIQEPYIMDLSGDLMYRSAHAFSKKHPYIHVKFANDERKKSVETLQDGKLDIALTIDFNDADKLNQIEDRRNLIYCPLLTEHLFVWMREDHPLASLAELHLEDLIDVPINMTANRQFDPMRFAVIDLFERHFRRKPVLMPAHSTQDLVKFFIDADDPECVFLVSQSVTQLDLLRRTPGMVARPIVDECANITSYIVLRADYQKKSIDDFLDVVENLRGAYSA